MLKQAVLAINSPKHRRHTGTPKGLGHAFCEYVTRYPIHRLPQAGGVDATIVVTMTLENLLGDSQAPALLDTGDPITADQARKLACEAGIIPMVLGGKSKTLDLGRRKRLYDRYQRIAIRHRDQHCTAQGCDWPAAMCHVHHNTPGAEAGRPTSPTDACSARGITPTHTHPKYQMKTIPNGRVIFSRARSEACGLGTGQEMAAFTSPTTVFSTVGAPRHERVRDGPQVTVVEVRRVLEAEGRVPVAELARVLEEDNDLPVRVRVGGHSVPGLGGELGGVRGHRHVHALGELTIVRGHLRDPVQDRLEPVGLLGALLALGAELGRALLHRSAFLSTEPVGLVLDLLCRHALAPFRRSGRRGASLPQQG